jgi:hypothetical protein
MLCPVFLISFFLFSQATLAAPEDAAPKKEEGISDKSSLLTLDEEHDLLKAESQDVPSEVKPLYQVSVKVNSSLLPIVFFSFLCQPAACTLVHPYRRCSFNSSSLLLYTFNDALVKC